MLYVGLRECNIEWCLIGFCVMARGGGGRLMKAADDDGR